MRLFALLAAFVVASLAFLARELRRAPEGLSDTEAFNKVYLEYFKAPLPAETLVQQLAPTTRSPDSEGHYPDLEQMSFIAIKSPAKTKAQN